VNNLAGLEVFSLQFTGNGSSTVSGNAILLDSDITSSQSGTTRISLQTITFNRGGGTLYALGTGLLNIESDLVGSGQAEVILYPFYTNSIGTNLLLQGSIQGAVDLVKLGDGVALLTGGSANTYSGATYVRGGTLYLSKTGVTAVSSKVVIGDTTAFSQLVDESTGNYPPALDVTVGGLGEWTLNETAMVTNLMMFLPTGDGYFGAIINGTGFLSLNCDVTVTNLGNPYYGGGILCTVLLGNQTRAFHISYNVDQTNFNQNYFNVGIVIGTGSAGIIKDGYGAMTFQKPNSYTGTTLIDQGILAVENNGGLPGSQTIIHDTLELDGVTTGEPINFDGGLFGGIAFYESNLLTGPLTLTTSPNLYSSYSAAFLGLNGVVSVPGALGVGPGIVQLGGTSPNTFTGGAYVEDYFGDYEVSTLQLAKPGNVIAVPGLIEVTPYGTNILQNLQDNGLQSVQLDSHSTWLLSGHSVAPQSLSLEGNATINTQGGQLQLADAPGTNRFYVLPNTNIFNPASNFTAQILGTLACL
ncbi:MAG: autotransporter-associated beta strand repeat-containing protein, partial [Limisphaerales bacterium]